MNLPSSLALPQSKLLQGRTGLLVLLLVVVLIGAGVYYFVFQAPQPPKTATVATSPAAVATPRPVPKPPVVYGPPAPDWVERVPVTAPVPTPGAPGAVAGSPAGVAAGAGTAAATAAGAGAVQAGAVPGEVAPLAGAPVVAGETPRSVDASVLFAREQYVYTSAERRDPFLSLLDGKFQGQGDGSLVDVGDIHLVGIMWGSSDKFALVEDSRGRGYVLRVGDPVVNGYISGITKSEIQVVQNAFGDTQMLSIQLKPKEGDKNAARN
jgi:hypothetical protein